MYHQILKQALNMIKRMANSQDSRVYMQRICININANAEIQRKLVLVKKSYLIRFVGQLCVLKVISNSNAN